MSPAERYLNDAVYEDLARHQPQVLMVLRHARDVPGNALRRLDYLRYFGRDPRIASELEHYRLAEDVGQYRFYVRTGAAEPGVPPRSEPGEHDVLRTRTTGWRALGDSGLLLHLLLFAALGSLGYVRETRRAQGDAEASAPQGPS